MRILIADDHSIMRDGLRSLLENLPGVEVIGEAENGRAAVKLAKKSRPDVIIMDITMPDLNGIDATRQIVSEFPGIKVIALSMHSNRQIIKGILSAGASGYLIKDCAFDELSRALDAVRANQIYLSPQIAGIVVENYVHQTSKDNRSVFSVLTVREREVLQLLAEGKTVKEIAFSLTISAKTVNNHRAQIMDKLNLHSVAELTKYAIREGITSPEI